MSTAKDQGTSVGYGIGPLARYYFGDPTQSPVHQARFFVEANAGIEGSNPAVGNSTNGLGLGIGPGIAYFMTSNVGLEALLKYQGIIGFGSSVTTSDLTMAFGLQIYLPHKTLKSAAEMKYNEKCFMSNFIRRITCRYRWQIICFSFSDVLACQNIQIGSGHFIHDFSFKEIK